MGLFNRKSQTKNDISENDDEEMKKQKGAWKRPANTAFKQQRLKAWQPILTPKTVLPTLFLVGLIFAPIGGLLIWGSGKVSQITLDYTNCDTLSPSSPADTAALTPLPKYTYDLQTSDSKLPVTQPRWAFSTDPNNSDPSAQKTCRIQFDLPADLKAPVFIYYRLTSFYQNHRRYVQSLDTDQLKGNPVKADSIKNGNCKPLGTNSEGKIIYPCGLIANSLFNDTISSPQLLSSGGSPQTIEFTTKGIAWPGERKKYTNKPRYEDYSQLAPPPNWALRYPQGYNESNIPQLQDDEHFQNWMRTAGLPTFSKLYLRNENQDMPKGTYQITVNMNFPVTGFGGTKSIVISTVSWIGGKNPFLGWAYIGSAALFVLLALLGTIRHIVKPRKIGDMNLLSWNR
jgi:hypothetical protein